MESLKLIIVGIVQGLTELLPVSSSGHILVLSELFNVSSSSFYLTAFHVGTTFAILLFFREKIFKDLLQKKRLKFLFQILVSSIPAAIVGALFDDFISEKLRVIAITAVSLIVWGIVMVLIEKKLNKESEIESITWKQSMIMGSSQILALIPGTSRSGISTIAGILTGLNKYVALEYSFILGTPILLGGFLWEASKMVVNNEVQFSNISFGNILTILIVVLVPFVVGYLSLLLLRRFKKDNWLTVFGVYRILMGIFILLVLL
ncbi:MAG: undecaprenyl-diphosphate phosphatase [Candidatus Dojkabacteria bacterium]